MMPDHPTSDEIAALVRELCEHALTLKVMRDSTVPDWRADRIYTTSLERRAAAALEALARENATYRTALRAYESGEAKTPACASAALKGAP